MSSGPFSHDAVHSDLHVHIAAEFPRAISTLTIQAAHYARPKVFENFNQVPWKINKRSSLVHFSRTY